MLGFCGFLVITVLLFVYILKVFLPALSIIGGYENEAVSPNLEQSIKATILIVPAILIYAASTFSFFYFKIRGFNKIIFPVCVFSYYWLFIFLGVASMGSAFGWIGVFTFIPAIVVLLISIILGWIIDRKYKTKNKQ